MKRKPNLDYPYLSLPDIDEETIDLMEQDYIYEQLSMWDNINDSTCNNRILSLPDIDENEVDPIWEQCRIEHLKQEHNKNSL
jgi:hypothetical protein